MSLNCFFFYLKKSKNPFFSTGSSLVIGVNVIGSSKTGSPNFSRASFLLSSAFFAAIVLGELFSSLPSSTKVTKSPDLILIDFKTLSKPAPLVDQTSSPKVAETAVIISPTLISKPDCAALPAGSIFAIKTIPSSPSSKITPSGFCKIAYLSSLVTILLALFSPFKKILYLYSDLRFNRLFFFWFTTRSFLKDFSEHILSILSVLLITLVYI